MGPGNDKPDIDGVNHPNETPHELTIDEIQTTLQDYVHAAKCAKEAGFDGIVLDCSNGVLLDCFLQSSTNQRTDQYGGSSMENRCRIVHEILDAIISSEMYPSNRIGCKFSPNGIFGDMGSDDNYDTFTYIARSLQSYNLAFLEIMDGLGFGFHEKGRIVTVYDIKKEFHGPIIASVGLTKEIAEGMIRSGTADMTSFGRAYITNPDLVQRFTNNWPLASEAEFSTWYSPIGAQGYTDFPPYTPHSSD
jgi:N-ethylmaleimide reductase